MVEVNRETTPDNTRWLIVDKDTGDRGHAIDWKFRVEETSGAYAGTKENASPSSVPARR